MKTKVTRQDILRANNDKLQRLVKTRGQRAAWNTLYRMVRRNEVSYPAFRELAETIPTMTWGWNSAGWAE